MLIIVQHQPVDQAAKRGAASMAYCLCDAVTDSGLLQMTLCSMYAILRMHVLTLAVMLLARVYVCSHGVLHQLNVA